MGNFFVFLVSFANLHGMMMSNIEHEKLCFSKCKTQCMDCVIEELHSNYVRTKCVNKISYDECHKCFKICMSHTYLINPDIIKNYLTSLELDSKIFDIDSLIWTPKREKNRIENR